MTKPLTAPGGVALGTTKMEIRFNDTPHGIEYEVWRNDHKQWTVITLETAKECALKIVRDLTDMGVEM